MKGIEEITHSCCPGKVDIHAPKFKEIGFIATRNPLYKFECEGCKTIIHVIKDEQ